MQGVIMSLISFVKEAGEKLFGSGKAKPWRCGRAGGRKAAVKASTRRG
jgi:hypothetical protein